MRSLKSIASCSKDAASCSLFFAEEMAESTEAAGQFDVLKALVHVAQREGIAGMFKGLSLNLVKNARWRRRFTP